MKQGCRTTLLILLLVCFIVGMGIVAIILFMARGRTEMLMLPSRDSVAIIEVEGPIFDIEEPMKQLERYVENDSVKALVIRMNSPGGAVAPSQEMFEELKKARGKGKKVVVSMNSVAASGAYYIACAADEIYANPGTITGSIGVIAEFPNIQGLMDKLGIQFETIKTGKFKDSGSWHRPMNPEEQQLLQEMLMDVYEQFVEAVAEGRKMPIDEVRKYADGRIFSGRQALEYGFVDALGTQNDAVKRAAALAGIKGEPRVIKKEKRTFPFGGFAEEMLRQYFPAAQPTYAPVLYLLR
ncbi:MAG: signal peptide peptidase SppA [Candidatus Abyssobacteria bacterium SURF_17]|uniref:Signal peptide peptidase SppA n=1 Tax=Candidatus Abyssobacteria bacterium SURF_17 TaxID=2093361 RepID=A0A419EUH4_9BACT|nr:MAG: signal peptide peptidase SppA [Candidatus Abyssubacteria bacterium SURF_17]